MVEYTPEDYSSFLHVRLHVYIIPYLNAIILPIYVLMLFTASPI